MKNTFRLHATLMAAFVAASLSLGTAHAQEAAPAAGDAGAITNSQTETTTTTSTTGGIAPAASTDVVDGDASMEGTDGTTQLANTGGEPLMFVLAGLSLAGGAMLLRRKVAV